MAAYEFLGDSKVKSLLEQTLTEEKETDQKLNEFSETSNHQENKEADFQLSRMADTGQKQILATDVPPMREPGIIFDLDGTLIDSVYQHVSGWRDALAQHHIVVAQWRIHRAIGMSGRLFLPKLLREEGHRTSIV